VFIHCWHEEPFEHFNTCWNCSNYGS
jgi:hypothetical protein